jgi:hypothetical protein
MLNVLRLFSHTFPAVEFVLGTHWLSLFWDHCQRLGLLDVPERVWSHVVDII